MSGADGAVRLLTSLAACALAGSAIAHAAPASKHAFLRHYVAAVSPRIAEYTAVVKRLDSILTERPMVDVDPKVEQIYRVASRFDELSVRWPSIAAPQGLKTRHSGMSRVFEIQARGWRIYADALFTRHPEELSSAIAKLGPMLRSAAYLQRRWAAALQGALIRAGLAVPRWLQHMASEPPSAAALPQS